MDDKPNIYVGYPVIYTNGAYVSAAKVTVNAREVWCWIAESFEDDSYFDGKVINPRESAFDKDDLLEMNDEEE